ncbi:unnamed protein product [Mycena citricolor]|nr:unnamed protein product [Mycena citricolor]
MLRTAMPINETHTPMTTKTLTFNQTILSITEFIEVAIHTILYVRQIYPADLFVRRKKYDTPVYQSRHPALNEYISGAVKSIRDQLLAGNVEKVVVVIKDKEEVALERFMFSVEQMVEIESFNKDTSVENGIAAAELGQYFRGFLVKLNLVESQLGPLNGGDDVSFAIVLELKPETAPVKPKGKSKNPPPWIPAFTQHTTPGTSDDSELHMRATRAQHWYNQLQESDVKLQKERDALKKRQLAEQAPQPPTVERTPKSTKTTQSEMSDPEG